MSNVVIEDVLECAVIGYLAKKTSRIWQIEIEREHMDFRIICRCGDIEFATRYIYSGDEIDKSGLFGVICTYLNEVVISWERMKENES